MWAGRERRAGVMRCGRGGGSLRDEGCPRVRGRASRSRRWRAAPSTAGWCRARWQAEPRAGQVDSARSLLSHRQRPVVLGGRFHICRQHTMLAANAAHAVEVQQHLHAPGLHPRAHALYGGLRGVGTRRDGWAGDGLNDMRSGPLAPIHRPHPPQHRSGAMNTPQ